MIIKICINLKDSMILIPYSVFSLPFKTCTGCLPSPKYCKTQGFVQQRQPELRSDVSVPSFWAQSTPTAVDRSFEAVSTISICGNQEYGKNNALQVAWQQQIFLVGRARIALLALPFVMLITASGTRSVPQYTAGGEGSDKTQTAHFTCMGRASLWTWVPHT